MSDVACKVVVYTWPGPAHCSSVQFSSPPIVRSLRYCTVVAAAPRAPAPLSLRYDKVLVLYCTSTCPHRSSTSYRASHGILGKHRLIHPSRVSIAWAQRSSVATCSPCRRCTLQGWGPCGAWTVSVVKIHSRQRAENATELIVIIRGRGARPRGGTAIPPPTGDDNSWQGDSNHPATATAADGTYTR